MRQPEAAASKSPIKPDIPDDPALPRPASQSPESSASRQRRRCLLIRRAAAKPEAQIGLESHGSEFEVSKRSNRTDVVRMSEALNSKPQSLKEFQSACRSPQTAPGGSAAPHDEASGEAQRPDRPQTVQLRPSICRRFLARLAAAGCPTRPRPSDCPPPGSHGQKSGTVAQSPRPSAQQPKRPGPESQSQCPNVWPPSS